MIKPSLEKAPLNLDEPALIWCCGCPMLPGYYEPVRAYFMDESSAETVRTNKINAMLEPGADCWSIGNVRSLSIDQALSECKADGVATLLLYGSSEEPLEIYQVN